MHIAIILLVFVVAVLLTWIGFLSSIGESCSEALGMAFGLPASKGIRPYHLLWGMSGIGYISGILLIVLRATGVW